MTERGSKQRVSYLARTVAVSSTQLMSVGAGAVIWPLLARRLAPAQFGTFQSAQVCGGLLGYVVFFGLQQYSLRRYAAQGDSWPVAFTLLKLRAVNGAAVMAIIALACALPKAWPLSLSWWVAAVIAGNLVRQSWPDWIFVSAGRAWIVATSAGLAGALNAIWIVAWVHDARDVSVSALAYLVASSLGLFFLIAFGRSVSAHGPKQELAFQDWRREMMAARAYGVVALAGQVIAYGDLIVLNVVGPSRTVGVYAAAFRVILVFQGLSTAIQSIALVAFTKLHVGGQRADADRGLAIATVAASVGFTLVAMALIAASAPLVRVVYGDTFSGSAGYLRLLAPMLPIEAVASIQMTSLVSSGQARLAAKQLSIGALVSVLVCAVLVPQFGAAGAAIGKLSGVGVVCVVAAIRMRSTGRTGVLLWGIALPVAGCALAALLF